MKLSACVAIAAVIGGSFLITLSAKATPGDKDHCKTLARLIDGPTYVNTPAGVPSMTYSELGLSATEVGPVGGYIESWVKYKCESKIGSWEGADKKWPYKSTKQFSSQGGTCLTMHEILSANKEITKRCENTLIHIKVH